MSRKNVGVNIHGQEVQVVPSQVTALIGKRPAADTPEKDRPHTMIYLAGGQCAETCSSIDQVEKIIDKPAAAASSASPVPAQ